MQASALLFPAATAYVTPAATELARAVSSELEAPPPRLMFATAGLTWFCVTQSMPATTPDVVPEPVQSRTRTGWRVTFLAMPYVVPRMVAETCGPCPWQSVVPLPSLIAVKPLPTRPVNSTCVARMPVSRT